MLATNKNRSRVDVELIGKNFEIHYLPSFFGQFLLRVLAIYVYYVALSLRIKSVYLINFSGYFYPFVKQQRSLAQNPFPLVLSDIEIRPSFSVKFKNFLIRILIHNVPPTKNRVMIFNSKHLCGIYNEYGKNHYAANILYQGMDASKYTRDEEGKDKKNSIVILSTITPHKRTLDSLRLLHELVNMKALPFGVEVDVVGQIDDSNYKNEIDIWLRENSSSLRVTIWGFVSASEKLRLLGRAKYYVSLSRCESFGIPLLEAQAAGAIPIIGAKTAQEEIGGHGVVLINEDWSNIAEVANVLLDAEKQNELIGAFASNLKRFEWSRIYENPAITLT